jgi:uncharacterized membrane protein YphA (DoxX/SURF4 family)
VSVSTIAFIAGLIVAGLFVWSGVAKLVDVPATNTAIAELTRRRVPRYGAATLVVAELMTALCLVIPATRRIGCVLSIGLLAIFSTVIAARLREGVAPVCQCFGSRNAQPISSINLIRNAAIGVLTIVALFG